MYYQEKWIKGILHYRNLPNADFKPFTKKMLNNRIIERETEILSLQHEIDRLKESIVENLDI